MSAETYVEVVPVDSTWSSGASGWAVIDYADAIACYEWDNFMVLRSPQGDLFTLEAGGCSCNDWRDSIDDVRPAENWHEVLKRLGAWATEYDTDRRKSVADELRSRLAEKRPRKHVAVPKGGFQE